MNDDERRMVMLKKLANGLKRTGVVRDNEGFVLLLFDHGAGGRLSYVSTSDRVDVLAAMLEFVDRQDPEFTAKAYERHHVLKQLGPGAERIQ